MNMNVLIDGLTPKVCSLKELLRAFLDHRQVVLIRRSRFRLEKIDHRLEVLEGFIVAFLNLDRVIDIIRYDEDPKGALMHEDWGDDFTRATSEFDYIPVNKTLLKDPSLSELQADAILNMRLRSLRRLEEIELRKERDKLMLERVSLEDLLDSEELQWLAIGDQIKHTKKIFSADPINSNRKTIFEKKKDIEEMSFEAMVEKEPVTVVCSKMGWVRSVRGHIELDQDLKFKDGDEKGFIFHAESTDRILIFGSNGRFYTIPCANLPKGRGMGEPVRLIVDLPNDVTIVDIFVHDPMSKLLLVSGLGDGFIVRETEVLAQTRSGKQVLNLQKNSVAVICHRICGDHVAVVSTNGKLLVFSTLELPEMSRGKGVRLQKYNSSKGRQGSLALDGGLSDLTTFNWSDGLSWNTGGGKSRNQVDMTTWLSKRAGVGRKSPHGFPKQNKFL
jgi:topoisomerase-4 subunit A